MFQSSIDKPFDEFGKQPIWHLEGVSKLFGNYCLIPKNNNDAYEISSCRLILRPLSDLTKEIEHNGEKFVPTKALSMWDLEGITAIDIPHIPVNLYELLLKWHFDVFDLIGQGLAIDINTLEI